MEVRVVRTREDVEDFLSWRDGVGVAAFDTENTGLDPFAPGFRCRLAQVSDTQTAWVFLVERGGPGLDELAGFLTTTVLVAHNLAYDLEVAEQAGLIPSAELASKRAFDTYLMAHLVNPIADLKLKSLAQEWVDADAPDSEAALHARFKELGYTKDTGWALIDLDDPTYLHYAGVDPLLTLRLFRELQPIIIERGLEELLSFEQRVAGIAITMEKRGLGMDAVYAQGAIEKLHAKEAEAVAVAERWGVTNVNSTQQVSDALQGLGFELVETTKTGKPKVDKAVLEAIDHPLAEAVLVAKNAGRWALTYLQDPLEKRDAQGRVHPSIKTLGARTARMSVSSPPLQQLPSYGGAMIRRAYVAGPGKLIAACDYSQVELRILAALSEEGTMLKAIADGADLHDLTAALLYGDSFTKEQRKLAKNTNFGVVYGGGAAVLARQAGVTLAEAKRAREGFKRAYPAIDRWGKGLQTRAEWGERQVITPSGRQLPLDRTRLYAATNYVVQSTATDVLKEALLELWDQGLGDYVLMPVHDEVLLEVDAPDAQEVAMEVQRVMSMDFKGVYLQAEAEVYGPSWGHGYGWQDA